MDRVVGGIQGMYRKLQYRLAGLNLTSQEAYEAAASGFVRPTVTRGDGSAGLICNLKCVHFDAPTFVLEVHVINESEAFLGRIIHNIGLELRSGAHCTGIRRIRYGRFDLKLSLVRQQWDYQSIIDNIADCGEAVLLSMQDVVSQEESLLEQLPKDTEHSYTVPT